MEREKKTITGFFITDCRYGGFGGVIHHGDGGPDQFRRQPGTDELKKQLEQNQSQIQQMQEQLDAQQSTLEENEATMKEYEDTVSSLKAQLAAKEYIPRKRFRLST